MIAAPQFAEHVEKPNGFIKVEALSRLDLAVLALLTLIFALFIRTMQWSAVPIEDAAMLLRYSQHLAQGHGITWNIGEHPVDGATDFLFMAAIAGLNKISGMSVIAACRVLDLAAALFCVLLLYIGPRKIFNCNPVLPFALALYLMAGPSIKMAAACFGAPFFAAAGLSAWYFANAFIEDSGNVEAVRWRDAIAFSLLALITGLVRPEGVLFAGFMLLAILYAKGWRGSQIAVVSFAVVFLLLGGCYFIWHWHYFGYPLPNPFYRKGNGHLYPGSLTQSIVNVMVLLAPVLPLLPLGFSNRKSSRRTVALLIPLVLFTGMWILLSNDNNHFKRFQYPIVPIVLFSLPGLLQGLPSDLRLPAWKDLSFRFKTLGTTCSVFALLVSMGYIDREFPYHDSGTGMREFAERLQPYASRGYTIALTEAGQLPLYSQWRVIDALGLNDSWIAHHGVTVTPEYLDRYRPEVIMVHVDSSGTPADFRAMIAGEKLDSANAYRDFAVLSRYARTRDYILAAAYGASPCNMHLYYVRRDFADSSNIISVIRSHPYYFLDSGQLSHDYRDELSADLPCWIS